MGTPETLVRQQGLTTKVSLKMSSMWATLLMVHNRRMNWRTWAADRPKSQRGTRSAGSLKELEYKETLIKSLKKCSSEKSCLRLFYSVILLLVVNS